MATRTITKKDQNTKILIEIDGVRSSVKTTDKETGLVSERVLYTKDLFDNMAQLVESAKERSGPMFQAYGGDYSVVRYWEELNSGFMIMVTEASPCIRTFNMSNIKDDVTHQFPSGSPCPFRLSSNRNNLETKIHWPYTVMFTIFQKSGGEWIPRDGFIAWADEPIKDNATPIYGLPLPNTYGPHGRSDSAPTPYRICWGGVGAFSAVTPNNVAGLLPIFYSSNFNLDLVDHSWLKEILTAYSYELVHDKVGMINGRITLNYLKSLEGSVSRMVLRTSTFGEALKQIRDGRA